MMEIRPVQTGDERELIRLIAAFRASLAELRGNGYLVCCGEGDVV